MKKNRTRHLAIEPLEPRLALSTFFVATTGSDTSAGTSAAPWRTLQNAANRVAAGDTVIVRAGNYAGFDLSTDGTAANPITFRGEPGAVVNAQNPRTTDGINLEGADHIVIEGFTVTGVPRAGIRSVLNHHVTIRNNNADNNGRWGIFTGFSDDLLIENNITIRSQIEHGIYVSNSGDRPVIRGNTIWGNRANGIHMNGDLSQGGDGLISGALVERNTIYDNGTGGGSGINADGVQSSRFQSNLLYNNHASGISLYRIDGAAGSSNNVVVNNTVLQAADGRWALNIQNGSTGNTVYNNILYNHHSSRGSIDISPDSLPGFTSNYNVVMSRFTNNGGNSVLTLTQWRSATGQDANSVISTPAALFVDVAAANYRLSPSSPARDAGTSQQAPAIDLSGSPRPSGAAWDIGAYEFQANSRYVAVGPDAGPSQPARLLDLLSPTPGAVKFEVSPYGTSFTAGVRVALADVSGDGVPDLITAPGRGGAPQIRVFDGNTGVPLPGSAGSFFAYAPAYTGGLFLASGDFNADGKADIVTGTDTGGGPHVRVFNGVDGSVLREFFAYAPAFTGGVRVAVGDVDGDGVPNIITGAGAGGGPHVQVFRPDGTRVSGAIGTFFVYAPAFTAGIYVAAGDINGDGKADVVTGAGAQGGPHVRAFSGVDGSELANFFAYHPAFTGGVRVTTNDLNGDGRADIITAPGAGGGPHVRAFSVQPLTELKGLFVYGGAFTSGVFVAGSSPGPQASPALQVADEPAAAGLGSSL